MEDLRKWYKSTNLIVDAPTRAKIQEVISDLVIEFGNHKTARLFETETCYYFNTEINPTIELFLKNNLFEECKEPNKEKRKLLFGSDI